MKAAREEQVLTKFFTIISLAGAATATAHAEDTPAPPATTEAAISEMMPCSKVRTNTGTPASTENALNNYRLKFEKGDDASFKVFDGELFYYIDFYKNDEGFHSLAFNIRFEKIKVGMKEINEWNEKRRFTRAYLTKDKMAVLEMDLNMEYGGMADCQFQDNLYVWLDSLGRFHDTIYKMN